MRRLLAALLVGAVASSPAASVSVARAEEQPSAAPGSQGGDPAPDAERAAQLLAAQRYEEAIAASKRSLGRNEKYVPALLVMAKCYYYLKKFEFSTSIVGMIHKIDPNHAEGFNLLGYLKLANDDRLSAAANFKKAVEARPDYGNAWNSLAAMYLQGKNYDGAVEAAEKATQLLPNFDKAWLNLGSAYRGKGRYEEAERAYRKALDFNSRSAEVYFNLGILYLDAPQMPGVDTTQRFQQAIAHFGRYKDFASLLPPIPNDPVDSYVEEANKGIVLEQKRLDRERKKAERAKAKTVPAETPPPPPTPAPEAAPAPAPEAAPPAQEAPPAPAEPAPTGPSDEPGFGGGQGGNPS